MNFPAILNILGHVLKYELLLLLIPFAVALFYGQGDASAFLYTILIMLPISIILTRVKGKKKEIYAKEGFLIVSLSWVIISVLILSSPIPKSFKCFLIVRIPIPASTNMPYASVPMK